MRWKRCSTNCYRGRASPLALTGLPAEFRVNNREMGHMHGSSWADLPFPMSVRDELVNSGKVAPHHILPASGRVTFYVKGDSDADALIRLFRMQYERMAKKAN